MANWVIRCSQDWLEPVYWRIHEKLLECGLIHMDETRIQCNKEEGKRPSSDSFMWVMRSAASEAIQAAFFYYSRTRSGDNAKTLLEGFNGYLITDAYAGYDKVLDIKRALCWSHYLRSIIIRGKVHKPSFFISLWIPSSNNNSILISRNLEYRPSCYHNPY